MIYKILLLAFSIILFLSPFYWISYLRKKEYEKALKEAKTDNEYDLIMLDYAIRYGTKQRTDDICKQYLERKVQEEMMWIKK